MTFITIHLHLSFKYIGWLDFFFFFAMEFSQPKLKDGRKFLEYLVNGVVKRKGCFRLIFSQEKIIILALFKTKSIRIQSTTSDQRFLPLKVFTTTWLKVCFLNTTFTTEHMMINPNIIWLQRLNLFYSKNYMITITDRVCDYCQLNKKKTCRNFLV